VATIIPSLAEMKMACMISAPLLGVRSQKQKRDENLLKTIRKWSGGQGVLKGAVGLNAVERFDESS
jgi:hypothetical protein